MIITSLRYQELINESLDQHWWMINTAGYQATPSSLRNYWWLMVMPIGKKTWWLRMAKDCLRWLLSNDGLDWWWMIMIYSDWPGLTILRMVNRGWQWSISSVKIWWLVLIIDELVHKLAIGKYNPQEWMVWSVVQQSAPVLSCGVRMLVHEICQWWVTEDSLTIAVIVSDHESSTTD